MRRRYLRATRPYKSQRVSQLVGLFGYHRKAALRALRAKPFRARASLVCGRPRKYSPGKLLPPLEAIWLAALQPCGVRLQICLAHELRNRGLTLRQQVILSLHYDGFHLDVCSRLDLPVNDAVTAELKTVENLLPVHKARALTYPN
jgi:hypothetical protein